MLRYFQTDALLVRSDKPAVAAAQAAAWDPLLDWAASEFGVRPQPSASLFGPVHPPGLEAALRDALARCDDWQLAGVTAASAAARSLLAAFALARGALRPAQAAAVLRVEEAHQTREWGFVEGGHDVDVADLEARVAAAAVFLALQRRAGG